MQIRQFMTLTLAASAVTALLFGGASQAQALGYTFTYSDGINIAYGTLSASGTDAISGTLYVTGGAAIGTYPLFANPFPPTVQTSPGGSFFYDDALYPASDPLVDNAGLLFISGGTEVNIFSNGPGNYSLWAANPPLNFFVQGNGGEFTLTEVPEPGAVAFGLVAIGSVLGLVARKRKS